MAAGQHSAGGRATHRPDQVTTVDSAGLALLAELAARLRAAGAAVAIEGEPAGLAELRTAYRLTPGLDFPGATATRRTHPGKRDEPVHPASSASLLASLRSCLAALASRLRRRPKPVAVDAPPAETDRWPAEHRPLPPARRTARCASRCRGRPTPAEPGARPDRPRRLPTPPGARTAGRRRLRRHLRPGRLRPGRRPHPAARRADAAVATTRGRSSTAGARLQQRRRPRASPGRWRAAYVKVVPRPVRLGVEQFLQQPRPAGHRGQRAAAGQAEAGRAVAGPFPAELARWASAASSTRPATPSCRNKSEDFGQTLGVWGWKRSRYVELPLFGPRTVRDVFGLVGDAPLSPIRGRSRTTRPASSCRACSWSTCARSCCRSTALREGAVDEYALFRDAWLQRRNYQIGGDRKKSRRREPARLPAGRRRQPHRAGGRDAGDRADAAAAERCSPLRLMGEGGA